MGRRIGRLSRPWRAARSTFLCARATGESNCQSGVGRMLNGCVDVELEVSWELLASKV
jgi:hypothetical protein